MAAEDRATPNDRQYPARGKPVIAAVRWAFLLDEIEVVLAGNGDCSEGGIRREPETPKHGDSVPPPQPVRNEFAFDDRDEEDEKAAVRNRRFVGHVQDNARRATLDPGNGIDL